MWLVSKPRYLCKHFEPVCAKSSVKTNHVPTIMGCISITSNILMDMIWSVKRELKHETTFLCLQHAYNATIGTNMPVELMMEIFGYLKYCIWDPTLPED